MPAANALPVIILCLLLETGPVSGYGQTYAVLFPRNSQGAIGGVCELYITTGQEAVTVQVTSGHGYNSSFSLNGDGNVTIDFPCENYRTDRSNATERHGIIIQSDDDIVVHGINQVADSADGFLAVPLTSDATDFVVGSYLSPGYGSSQFYMTGSDDNTGVTIRPKNGNDISLTLNRYDTFGLWSPDVDYTGSLITSNKPIAVFSGNEYGRVPSSLRYPDQTLIAVPPVSQLGQQFIVPPLGGRHPGVGYVVRIIAARGNTISSVSGYGDVTLATGEYREVETHQTEVPLVVTCSEGCLVVQYNKGAWPDGKRTDPFSMVVTPVERYASRFSWMTARRETFFIYDNYVSIVAPTNSTGGVRFNGVAVEGSWTPVSGTNFSSIVTYVGEFQNVIEHQDRDVMMAVFTYGHAGNAEEAYGYPAGPAVVKERLTTTKPTETTQPPVVTTHPSETTQAPIATSQPPAVETTEAPVATTQPSAQETTQAPLTTEEPVITTIPTTPAPVPDDVIPPVQEISVNGFFLADDVVLPDCQGRHYNAFLQRAGDVIEQINVLLGDGLCPFLPVGSAFILEYSVDLELTGFDQGEVTFNARIPAVQEYSFYDQHACGQEIQAFMQDHSNYQQPVLPPVAGCPNLTPLVEGTFSQNYRIWECEI